MKKSPRSAYIHIPFCHRRCFYCDFAVIPMGDKVNSLEGYGSKTINNYLDYLIKEILSIKHKTPLSTIYIGGGTPSILDPIQIEEIIRIFKNNYGIDFGAEITMEIDPASFNETDLNGFIKAGINRFSLGAQSFDNKVLQQAGRRHFCKDVKQSCNWLETAKFEGLIRSWSLDLIQNLPGINLENWKIDLKNALSFNPPHISIYDLNVEEGTVFKKLFDLGKLPIPNDEQSYENSNLTNLMLKNSGYLRYEISNYSLPGHQSRHNRVYWQGSGWWSFGQGSTSSPWGKRLTRPRISRDYQDWVIEQCQGKLDESLLKNYDFSQSIDEKIMLGLRLKEGINIRKLLFEEGWEKDDIEENIYNLLNVWQKYFEDGTLVSDGERFFLSDPNGMDLSNQIIIAMFQWWDKVK